jgi:hypothetical protein
MPFDLSPVFGPLVLGSGDLPHTHQEPRAPQPRGPQIVWSSSGYEWSSTVAYETPGFRWLG